MNPINVRASRPAKRGALLASIAILLIGCASDPNRTTGQSQKAIQSPIDPSNITIASVTEGLRLASLSREPLASTFRTKAAKLALASGQYEDAARILGAIQASNIAPNATVDYLLTKAQLALINGDPGRALALLNQKDLTQFGLSDPDQIALGLTKANAYQQTGRMLAAARTRVLMTPMLSSAAVTDNHEQLFNGLMTLPTALLKRYANDAVTNDLRGWLSLAAMTKQLQNRPS
ncbi:MAG: outer membrane PBP1 activator LpoA protein, partial [Candidatus Azotimanducaceae bacterium]